MSDSPSFQEIVFRLQQFWRGHGCALIQPFDCEVGAGTFHPATFLRAIGTDEWKACYVQPCRRPQDGRYGHNPNRLQHYYQFQTVLKPSPDDFQELYLLSLAKLGVCGTEHDIRFVEDDWKSPILGAWGLGWEVWLDGMEISQFTYFQEVGGLPTKPVTGEITYGLERLAMFLQKCDNVFDLRWDENMTYGDMFRQNEHEQCFYNFEFSDPEVLVRHFNDHEKTTLELLSKDPPLVTPAYESTMKCSHLFNLLDARGAISFTERAQYIGRVRNLSCGVARAYFESRKNAPTDKNNEIK